MTCRVVYRNRPARPFFVSFASLAFLFFAAFPADAQSPTKKGGLQPSQTVPSPTIPDDFKMSMLIRSTLIALSQANLTGNYTVLRDLGSPDFQATNSAARLTEAFTDLRTRRLDFSPIFFFDPKLVRAPTLDESGRLRLTGFMETRPEQINFDMLFSYFEGDWRLFGLAVEMRQIPAAAATTRSIQKNSTPITTGSAAEKDNRAPTKVAPPSRSNWGWAPTTLPTSN